jgi:hypothetical protein
MQNPTVSRGFRASLAEEGKDFRLLARMAFSRQDGSLSPLRLGLVAYFVFFQLSDLVLTQIGLAMGIMEGNGLASGILGASGGWGLSVFKLAATGLVVLLIALLSVRYRKIWVAIYVGDFVMTLVVSVNALTIWQVAGLA